MESSELVRLVAVCDCGADMAPKESLLLPYYAMHEGVLLRVADGLRLQMHVCGVCGANQIHCAALPEADAAVGRASEGEPA